MKVLISGASVAGPVLAYWLTEYGLEVTVVERAPTLAAQDRRSRRRPLSGRRCRL